MGGIRGYLSAGKGNDEYENQKVKLEELRCKLDELELKFKVQGPDIDRLNEQIGNEVKIIGGGEIWNRPV